MKKIIFASNNQGKIREMKRLLKNYEVIGLKEAGIKIDITENGKTFESNALIKAKEILKYTNEIIIADDSGLCVDALNGFPGILTHRFLGENATDSERNQYILDRLKDLEPKERTAQAITAMAVIKNGIEFVITAELNGKISNEERGTKGFGFDPIFEMPGGKTLGEMVPSRKNERSSRKKAIEKLKKHGILT